MRQIILTGFKPFGQYKFNPTEESTKYFDNKIIEQYNIKGIVLPCTYKGAFQILKEVINNIKPVAILSTGLSSNVKGVRFETVGRNIMNGKYPDTNGYAPKK
jgi:pyroglutamyl-peptidase